MQTVNAEQVNQGNLFTYQRTEALFHSCFLYICKIPSDTAFLVGIDTDSSDRDTFIWTQKVTYEGHTELSPNHRARACYIHTEEKNNLDTKLLLSQHGHDKPHVSATRFHTFFRTHTFNWISTFQQDKVSWFIKIL